MLNKDMNIEVGYVEQILAKYLALKNKPHSINKIHTQQKLSPDYCYSGALY